MATVSDILSEVSALVNQDEDTSNLSSSDSSLYTNYINRAIREWGEVAIEAGVRSLYKEYNMSVSTSTGNASIALPADFRREAGPVTITYDGSSTDDFSVDDAVNWYQYNDTDKRVVFLGNPDQGYTMRYFGSTLASGASVKVPYYATPTSVASPSHVPMVPSIDYLTQRTISLVWEAREDSRFPQAKVEADKILQNMLTQEQVLSQHHKQDRVRTVEETRYGNFRIGEN